MPRQQTVRLERKKAEVKAIGAEKTAHFLRRKKLQTASDREKSIEIEDNNNERNPNNEPPITKKVPNDKRCTELTIKKAPNNAPAKKKHQTGDIKDKKKSMKIIKLDNKPKKI
ncbi:15392_t:CDS:2 [Gigaspora rosea]|nr:15392_t:CDS:2 [Gigaspora rosea]